MSTFPVDELAVECLTSDLFFLRLFANQRAAAQSCGVTLSEIQSLCSDNDVEKNISTVIPSSIKGLTFRYVLNPNRSTSSAAANVDSILKCRRQVDVSVIKYLKDARRDRRPDCRCQLESTTVFKEYVAVVCLALDGTPMRKFTDVFTAANALDSIPVAALKVALYAADNKCAGFRWEVYEGQNEYVSNSETHDVPLKVLIAMRQAGNTVWLAEGADTKYFQEEIKDVQMLKHRSTFYLCKIECHNSETGTLLGQFENSAIAANKLGLEVQYINDALWSPRRLYDGKKWSYVDRITSSKVPDPLIISTSRSSTPCPTSSANHSSFSPKKVGQYNCMNRTCKESFDSSQGLSNHKRSCDRNKKTSRTKNIKKSDGQEGINGKDPSSSKSTKISRNRVPSHGSRKHSDSYKFNGYSNNSEKTIDSEESNDGMQESSRDHTIMESNGWLFKVPVDHQYSSQCELIGQPTIRYFQRHEPVLGRVEAYWPAEDVWRNIHEDDDAEDLEKDLIMDAVQKALKANTSNDKHDISNIRHKLLPSLDTPLSDGDDECHSINDSENYPKDRHNVECGSDVENLKRKRNVVADEEEREEYSNINHDNETGISLKPNSNSKDKEFPTLPSISTLSSQPQLSLFAGCPGISFLPSSVPESYPSLILSPDSFDSIEAYSEDDDRCGAVDDNGSQKKNNFEDINDITASGGGSSCTAEINKFNGVFLESVAVPGRSETLIGTFKNIGTLSSKNIRSPTLPTIEIDNSIDQKTGLPYSILISMAIASLAHDSKGYTICQIVDQISHLFSEELSDSAPEEWDGTKAKDCEIVTRILNNIAIASEEAKHLPQCKGQELYEIRSDFIHVSGSIIGNNSKYLLATSALKKISLLTRASLKIKLNPHEK